VLAFALLSGLDTPAAAQNFPTKSITLIVPNPPGGVVDTSARLHQRAAQQTARPTVVVENKGGASGNIAYPLVTRAPKDGYTLLVSHSAYHVGNPAMFAKLPWEQKELAPVALIATATERDRCTPLSACEQLAGIHQLREDRNPEKSTSPHKATDRYRMWDRPV
jgi:tripartite-type tricarboxylate transporter receptor subunit TctC